MLRGAEKQIWVFSKVGLEKNRAAGNFQCRLRGHSGNEREWTPGTGVPLDSPPPFGAHSTTRLGSLLEGRKCLLPHCSLVGLPWTLGPGFNTPCVWLPQWWDPGPAALGVRVRAEATQYSWLLGPLKALKDSCQKLIYKSGKTLSFRERMVRQDSNKYMYQTSSFVLLVSNLPICMTRLSKYPLSLLHQNATEQFIIGESVFWSPSSFLLFY